MQILICSETNLSAFFFIMLLKFMNAFMEGKMDGPTADISLIFTSGLMEIDWGLCGQKDMA